MATLLLPNANLFNFRWPFSSERNGVLTVGFNASPELKNTFLNIQAVYLDSAYCKVFFFQLSRWLTCCLIEKYEVPLLLGKGWLKSQMTKENDLKEICDHAIKTKSAITPGCQLTWARWQYVYVKMAYSVKFAITAKIPLAHPLAKF